MKYSVLIILCLVCCVQERLSAQAVYCPPNIDFESGNFSNWVLYTGSCCPISTPTVSGAVAGRHTITSGTAVDPYGGFPVVAPGGSYSLKLGNDINGRQAERARYYVHVPAGINNYSLIFRYAVVFQDPGHDPGEQPRFEVKGYDSATGVAIPCAQFTFVAASALPGFSTAPGGGNVRYKPWSTASIDLSGCAGKTVAVDFASGDCDLGLHFGYGYVDINCALFQISTANCSNSPTTTLSAPPGFHQYEWRDSTLGTLIDTLQSITIATPPVTTKYALILKPYPGFGCPDTLYTYVKIFHLNANVGNDTLICKNDTAKIKSIVSGSAPPFTYAWAPAANLTCSNCANPFATPPVTTSYVMTVSDENGCTKTDTVTINVNQGPQVTLTGTDVSCFGAGNGQISSNVTGGITPYTYSWGTTPVATTMAISNLTPGIYNVLVKDNLGCKMAAADTITQPQLLKDTITSLDVLCYAGTNASATVTASGGVLPYVYTWNTVPPQNSNTISAISAGSYIVTIADAHNCLLKDTVVITQPAQLNVVRSAHTNVSCYGGTNGVSGIAASGGTPPYTYSWNSTPVITTALATGLSAGIYTVSITDANGCVKELTDTITQPAPLVASIAKTDVSCFNGANGTVTTTVTGGTAPYKFSWNTVPVITTPSINSIITGNYTVTVTDTLLCTTSASVTVNQPTELSTVLGKTNVSCNGDANGSAVLTASGGVAPYTYLWNTVPVQSVPAIVSLTAGTYIVTTKDVNNCSKNDTVVINQPTVLNTSVSKINVTCFGGNNGSATVVATGGTAPYAYSWSTTPTQTTAVAQNLASSNYTVLVTDNNGCTKTDVVNITQPALLIATTTKTDINCFGDATGIATVAVNGGTTPYTYSWNTSPVQLTASASSLSAGTYTVTIHDGENCPVTASATINQRPQLILSPMHTNASCFGLADGSAGITASGGTAPYTYSWNTTPVQTTPSITNLAPGSYIATVKDNYQCSATTTIGVGQPMAVQTAINTSPVSCYAGGNGTAGVSVTGGTVPYTYSWNTSPAQNAALAGNLTSGQYIVTITDAKGCIQKDTAVVNQPPLLLAFATVTPVTCYNGQNGTATVQASGGVPPYTYSWNTTPVQNTPVVTGLSAGKYIMQLTDANGCSASLITDSLKQPDDITVLASPTAKTCMWLADGKGKIDTIYGGTQPYSIAWNTTPVQTTSNAVNLMAGTYTVTITDAVGCTKQAGIIVENYPQPQVYAGGDTTICPGGTTQLTASGAAGYVWNASGDLSCLSCANPIANPAATATYTVVGTDANNCSDTDAVIVTIAEKQGGEVGPDMKICRGDSVQLQAGGGITYLWTPGGQMNDNTLADPKAAVDANTTFTVFIKENECFMDTLTQYVQVFDRPTVNLGPDLSGIPGATLPLHAAVTNTTGIVWVPGEGLNCTNCYDPVASLTSTITYNAYVNNDSVCFAQDDITIKVVCDGSFLFIPNTFTPNGDGRNDYFFASAHGLNAINLMRVFNRWGEKVFEARNIAPGVETNGWDGRYKNAELSPDVYVYYFEVKCANGETIFLKGDISLIR